jgi:replicative DNA helicase
MNAQFRDPSPSNIEAEQAILGALMLNNASLMVVPTGFKAEHFYESIHQQIYDAILRGREAKKGMNPVTVRSFMSPESASAKIGSLTVSQYLARLTAEAVSVANVPDFADAITGCYHRREAMSVADDTHLAGIKAQDELEFIDRIKECRERLTAIVADIESRNEPAQSFTDAIDGTFDATAEAMAGRSPEGLDPGIPEVKALTGPWQPGNLIIIGGDVKQGKSGLAWQIFFNLAENHAVAGNSGEMQRSQLIMREKARRTGISAKRQKLGQVSDQEMQDLLSAGQDMKRLKFMDINCQQLTLEQIDQRVERLVGEHGIEAFVVDHILKLAWTGKMDEADDFKKANRATSTLKNIGMKRGVTMIALTHLNKNDNSFQAGRGASYRERLNSALRKRPTYKQLLGNIDKDADHALIVFQPRPIIIGMEPEEGTPDHDVWREYMDLTKGKAELILSLSRESEPSRREIQWNGATTSYGPDFKATMNRRELF